MKKPHLIIALTVLLYGTSAAQNSNHPGNLPASPGGISIFEAAPEQNSSVWGSVENLEALKSSEEYLTVSSQLNLSAKQILPSSKNSSLLKVYEFACDCNEEDLYRALLKISGIKGLEYGPKYDPLVLPDDYNLTFSNMWSLDLINAEQAWSITQGDCNVGVAVSDQNYYPNHPELVGKITYYDPTNTAPRYHGTAVATVVAANTNNGIGFSSIGYDLKVALYRMGYNDILAASYAGAKVINISWASGCSYSSYVQSVIDEVYDNGTFIVAAAGNGGTCGGAANLVYPAACDNVFAVTSIGPSDNHERTIGSPSTTHQHNGTVDLSAPGYDVPLTPIPGWYMTGNGTSFAAPYVTGTVGLMLCANPCLLNQEIEDILKNSSVNIDALNTSYAGLIGAGRLDAGAAVAMAYNSSTNTDPCGAIACDPSQSVDAGPCQTVYWGYTDDYATVELDGITSGGNGITTSTWTDESGNVIGNSNSISFLADASTAASGNYVAATYTLTYTDEFGCSVSDDVDVYAYNVLCTNSSPGSVMPKKNKILVCHNGNSICISENAVENHLVNHADDKLGLCNALSPCNASKSNSNVHESSTIRVYPNPTKGSFSIQLGNNQEGILEIYDVQGKMVWSQQITSINATVVDLTSEQNGIYIVKLIAREGVFTQRIIKQQ